MSPIRIIGVGSPFGQDRYGWQAVDALRDSDPLQHYPDGLVSLHRCDRPGMDLLNVMRGADGVIIIDAVQSTAVPGTLHCFDAQAFRFEASRFIGVRSMTTSNGWSGFMWHLTQGRRA